ncbi:MAG: hypothetical protein ABI851_14740 [Saprospiraceae bacterium]
MNSFFGIIELDIIENIDIQDNSVELITVKFVHYPDCQQLIIWLPTDGYKYSGNFKLVNKTEPVVLINSPVGDLLNGSRQIILNSLEYPPGKFLLEIDIPSGGKHKLHFTKFDSNYVSSPNEYIDPELSPESITSDIVYKDSTGEYLENEDLILRKKVLKEIESKFTRYLEYEGNFRSGYIIYVEGETRIKFMHEMCGGKYKFSIELPKKENWEAETKLPLNRRQDIIDFVATKVKNEKASNWQFELREDEILFY